jgi:hypothetical protein
VNDPASATVGLSTLLPNSVDDAWTERALFERHYERLMPSGDRGIGQLFGAVDQQFADLAPLLKLPAESQALSGFWKAPSDEPSIRIPAEPVATHAGEARR